MVVLDDRPPGMFSLEEVMQAGSSRHLQQLWDLQGKLSCDDPIKILFTSVMVTCSGSGGSVLEPSLQRFSHGLPLSFPGHHRLPKGCHFVPF